VRSKLSWRSLNFLRRTNLATGESNWKRSFVGIPACIRITQRKAVRLATPAIIKKEIEDRKVAKYERAVAAYDEWETLHPKSAILSTEEEARRDILERALDRAESAVLEPEECDDCGTCDLPGSRPKRPRRHYWMIFGERKYR
jgi:hypothetical protein